MNEIFTINISASAVAWYGAIVATLGFCFSAYQIWRDSSRLKITLEEDLNFFNAEPLYKEGVDYIGVSVVNRGRRAIRIDQASLLIFGESGRILFADSFQDYRNKILTEENPKTQFFVESSKINFDKIKCVIIVDGTGKLYKKYTVIFPSFTEGCIYFKKKLKYFKK